MCMFILNMAYRIEKDEASEDRRYEEDKHKTLDWGYHCCIIMLQIGREK